MLKYRIEGFSTISMDDALGEAMTKAAAFASQDHDMHVAVLELTVLPGRGFKAVVEVTIIPITFRETLHREAADVELKRINDEGHRARRKFGDELGKDVAGHFLRVFGSMPDIPNVYLVNLTESQIKNYFIEKIFYRLFAANTGWNLITDTTVLKAIQSVLDSQTHHHVEYDGAAAEHALGIDSQALENKVEAEFDHAVHPEHTAPPKPDVAPAAPVKRPKAPGLREDDEF
jgi:hypothetical protein